MAHTCPRCGSLCHCSGDIDDIDFGEDPNCMKDHNGCESEDDDDDWGDEDLDTPYQESGLVCEKCGHTDSIQCEQWNSEKGDTEPSEILCGKHAAEAGYCCCCGTFCAGSTSFDFHHPGYCDNCYDQVKADTGEDDDDDYEGGYEGPYPSAEWLL